MREGVWVEIERVSHEELARQGPHAARAKRLEWEDRAKRETLRIVQPPGTRFVVLERFDARAD
jgi:hypothetical protein